MISTNEEHICVICLELIENKKNLIYPRFCSCKVKLHKKCLKELEKLNSGLKCPICRIKINNNLNFNIEQPNILINPLTLFIRHPGFFTFIIYLLCSVLVFIFYVIPIIIIHILYDRYNNIINFYH